MSLRVDVFECENTQFVFGGELRCSLLKVKITTDDDSFRCVQRKSSLFVAERPRNSKFGFALTKQPKLGGITQPVGPPRRRVCQSDNCTSVYCQVFLVWFRMLIQSSSSCSKTHTTQPFQPTTTTSIWALISNLTPCSLDWDLSVGRSTVRWIVLTPMAACLVRLARHL